MNTHVCLSCMPSVTSMPGPLSFMITIQCAPSSSKRASTVAEAPARSLKDQILTARLVPDGSGINQSESGALDSLRCSIRSIPKIGWVNTSTLRKILLPRLSMLQKSPNPRITSRSQLPSTPVVRRDCLARALPRRLGNLQDVAEDVASFAPQISRITVLGWGNLPNPSDPKGQSTWWCMVLKETKKWKMVR